jgi:molybdopterin converting factor small subunit
MRIKVYAPLFGDAEQLDESGYLEMPAGARLRDLYRKLNIPLIMRNAVVCQVNYERCGSGTKLQDGDIVSFIGPLSGG